MSEELVEELEKRLTELSLIAAWEPRDAGTKRCARECLRQMEYARRCVGISGPTTIEDAAGSVTKTISHAEVYLPELRLAPDDWTP